MQPSILAPTRSLARQFFFSLPPEPTNLALEDLAVPFLKFSKPKTENRAMAENALLK